MRIVVQHWNDKYHVQFTWGPLEQTFRVAESALTQGQLEQFARDLIPEVERVFLNMAEARKQALA
jgi:hypothetical protein